MCVQCTPSHLAPALAPLPSHSTSCRSDCWEEKNPPRDPATGELRADTKRFPSGMKALGDYVHGKGLSFAIYSAESTETCGGYPASLGREALDAACVKATARCVPAARAALLRTADRKSVV